MSQYCVKHTEDDLKKIYLNNEYDETYFHYFIYHYNNCFSQLREDYKDYTEEDWLEEGDSVQERTLNLALDYIVLFLKSIEKGHGLEWSNLIADYCEVDETIYYHVYSDLEKINPTLAKNEIKILANSISDDENFQNHYLYLFEEGAKPENRIDVAKKYSELYKQALQEGKTNIYAHQYADLMSEGESHKIYCEEYAFAYDKAKKQNKNDEYANLYADIYSEALVNIKRRYIISDAKEMIKFAIKKVNAYMDAWEYAKEQKLHEFQRFADIYENIYLNFEFEYSENKLKSKEEVEKLILEKVLERFNK